MKTFKKKVCSPKKRTRKHLKTPYSSQMLNTTGKMPPFSSTWWKQASCSHNPQGGISRAEWEANLSRAWQKLAVLPFPHPIMLAGPHGQLICVLPRGTIQCNSSAKVVSVGPSGGPSLHLHPAAMRLKEMIHSGVASTSTYPWDQYIE